MQNGQPENYTHFWDYDINYWMNNLSSTAKGLSSVQVILMLKQQGRLKKKTFRFQKDLKLFIGQFKSPLMILLIGAVFLSAFIGDPSDVYIILFIVLSTGILSFIQERNASRVVEKLQSMIAIKCNVLRDGVEMEIEAGMVLAGDVIIFHAGDMIPADCLLISTKELHVNESSLTGESFPARKNEIPPADLSELVDRTHCLWEGTSVVSGTGAALVINVGAYTLFGEITKNVLTTAPSSFEIGIKKFGYFLMTITLALSVFIMIVNLASHKIFIESALFALALAVGMAPELLPAITTIAMSAGAKKMLQKKVIVKKLASIQNLGEVNLLCTDKTGTITEGVITIKGFVNAWGNASEFVKKIAYWNASLQSGYSNAIDASLKNIKLLDKVLPKKIDEVPYDFNRKKMSVLIKEAHTNLMITKGAFNEILDCCTSVRKEDGSIENINNHIESIKRDFEAFGLNGYRIIAICYKYITVETVAIQDEASMIFAGLIQFQDPIKSGIIETIAALNALSVSLKIISGDNQNIAKSIAHQIGIMEPVLLTGKEIKNLDDKQLADRVKGVHVFAEIEPIQKERIILLLKKSFSVAYMGDGINDVSAINVADVGISVANAVDIAKEAADVVLIEKNIMVIVDGIKEGRKTFANTLKYIFVNTGSTFGNMFSVAFASLLLPFLPMLPKQILLTNFITDLPYLSISADNVDSAQLRKPGKWNLKLIRNYMILFGLHSTIFDIVTFVVLLYVLKVKESTFQTGWFVESILTELLILFIMRTHRKFFKSKPGKYLIILSAFALLVTIVLPYLPIGQVVGLVPLPIYSLCCMLIIALVYIVTADMLKFWFFKQHKYVH